MRQVYLDYNRRRYGRMAQLVRALLSHSRGPGFESLCAHKITVYCQNFKEPPTKMGGVFLPKTKRRSKRFIS